ncbi:zeta toxin family protein [Bifidobacterium tibiigranuli]|jgi:hypothetical protein|uniref:zeta toxin family protein n=1 Tax=Bifidobacterium tibiigranuli TaxID=2172043 RepID=UPI0023529E60|nr:zeta toxin family protein [Bifidobacterium tibiigranuli]MCH3973492.1 zeta toxin family protein [Bifidobacterium tibiigranuli]
MGPFDLDDATLRRIYDSQISQVMPLHEPEREPCIVLVAAQPGAGKTRAVSDASDAHAGAYALQGDEFRHYHPAYKQVMRADPLRMPAATAQASSRWAEMAMDSLQRQHNSLVLETTMRHPDAVQRTLDRFKTTGYRTEAVIVATPPEQSLMGTMIRYIEQTERNGRGRWVDPSVHDEAVRQMPKTLTEQIAKGGIDHVTITNRAGETLYAADVTPENHSEAIASALRAISEGQRFDRIPPDQRAQWEHDVRHVRAFVGAHPEDAQVARLAARITAPAQARDPGRPQEPRGRLQTPMLEDIREYNAQRRALRDDRPQPPAGARHRLRRTLKRGIPAGGPHEGLARTRQVKKTSRDKALGPYLSRLWNAGLPPHAPPSWISSTLCLRRCRAHRGTTPRYACLKADRTATGAITESAEEARRAGS